PICFSLSLSMNWAPFATNRQDRRISDIRTSLFWFFRIRQGLFGHRSLRWVIQQHRHLFQVVQLSAWSDQDLMRLRCSACLYLHYLTNVETWRIDSILARGHHVVTLLNFLQTRNITHLD